MSTTRQRVEIYWGDQPPGLEEMASPAPTGEMIFDPADVGMLGRASGSREPGTLPGIGRASAVHGSNVAAIASATGQSESSVQQNLGDISMPTVGGDRGFDARSNRIAHHTNVLQQNRVIKGGGPWSVFGDMSGNVGYSYGGDDEGGGEGGEGGEDPRPDITLPPHVETTGHNTKLYEIMMIKGWSQADIHAWANESGLGFWDAVDQLFAESVPTEWKSPWEQHIEKSGFAEGTSLEEAWAQIGAGGEDGVVQLYQGEEGTKEHYEHDLAEGLTQLSHGSWANQRYTQGQNDDGIDIFPIDQAGVDAWAQEYDEIMGDTDIVSQEEFDAQAHADKMHKLQQDEWARAQGYRDLKHFFEGDDPEEDEGDFTESVQAAEDFYGGKPPEEVKPSHWGEQAALGYEGDEEDLAKEEQSTHDKKLKQRAEDWAKMEEANWAEW